MDFSPDDNARLKVLFLCTGNSARSQMAEAIINHRMGDVWQAYSAGVKPAGYVHPAALQALQELGIHLQGRSKHVDELREIPFDLVVTVCDSAAEECPLWLGPGRRIHLSFRDPAAIEGSQEEKMAVFRQVRDQIVEKIPLILQEHKGSASASEN
jgi:arsenate reductase (thioredoxin)